MKSLPFIVAIAALLLGSYVTAAEATAETKVVQISQKYSKAELDMICAREGGSTYGTAQDIYGCARGGNVVACNSDGTCTGYMWLSAARATDDADYAPIKNWDGNAELVLQMPVTLPKAGLDSDPATAQ
ncbi:MAG TPA: hypothetical protein VG742_16985 [Dongiaceae bacterium]|nr:hypothetical protein [Dongiaceae bacterium]